ncbi:C1orf109 [Branchiostoma lanceolatum]|uniref:C1orf109 protein n=1 Tax=Branchiostoma lanceolatum TaxID=7740 RepID=A0A8K0A7G4_BRALA|nr:C1orf109 [Branchiostoma lanceolatum]
MQAEILTKRQLKSAYVTVQKQTVRWKEIHGNSEQYVNSLCNLSEQLDSCEKVPDDLAAFLKDFPDLKIRLRAKLLEEMEKMVGKLRETLCSLQEVSNSVSRQYAASMHTYHTHAVELGIPKVVERSATEPSVADMLEWLGDIDRAVRELYLQKQFLLDTLSYDDTRQMQSLLKKWTQGSDLDTMVMGILAHLTFFLEDS